MQARNGADDRGERKLNVRQARARDDPRRQPPHLNTVVRSFVPRTQALSFLSFACRLVSMSVACCMQALTVTGRHTG
jgi:hypothetical protein